MKYWAYVNNEILGPFEKEKLLELPSFSPSLLVCPQTPVGEKTEDWKEAATYPELSALLGSGSMAPKAAPAPEARPAQEPSALEKPAAAFKPMVSSSIEQTPPSGHSLGGIDIAAHSLGKARSEEPAPAVSAPHQSSANFDPISLSQIVRRTENAQPQEAAPAAGEPLAKEPPAAFSSDFDAPKPALETPSFTPPAQEFRPAAETPAFTPSAAPELETFSRPAAGASFAQPDKGAMDALSQKLDALAKNAATKQDLSAAIDPFHLKLDQLGEVISSIKGSQYPREIMDKLAYLENSLAELKGAMRSAPAQVQAQAPAPEMTNQQEFKIERNSDTVFGATPPRQEKSAKEAAKEAAAKETGKAGAKPMEIVDQGGDKSSKLGGLIKKFMKFVVTLVLLVAVLLGGIIGLKKFGIFDATAFLPFPIPFTGAGQEEQPAPEAQPAPVQPPQAAQPAEPQAQAQPKEPDRSPEIIYFTRTYRANPKGPSLEDKINENAALQGGDYGQVNWKVKQGGEGVFEIAAIVPAENGKLTYSYIVDYNKKSILPSDESGKAAFDALTAVPRRVKGAGKGRKAAPAKAAGKTAKAAPAPKAAKAAAAPKAKADDEYEYVYEEDDGTGQ